MGNTLTWCIEEELYAVEGVWEGGREGEVRGSAD